MPELAPGSFASPMIRVGLKGVQLNAPLTELQPEEAARLTNWVHTGGELVARPGQTLFLSAVGGASAVHSMRRGWSPDTAVASLFWGAGANWNRSVNNGVGAVLEGGFSGDPLTMVPIRKPQAAGSWMLVADRLKMRKAGLATTGSLPIGLPAPSAAPLTTINATFSTPIAAFDASDGSQAASWSKFAGLDDTRNASGGVPTGADVTGVSGNAVAFTTNQGTATAGYQSLLALPKALNLSVLGGGGPAASDDDLIHLFLRYSDPQLVKEVRVYFVCSPFSATASIPGTSTTENVAAYLHSFTPSDYAAFVGGMEDAPDAGERASATSLLDDVPVAPGRFKAGDFENEVIPFPEKPTSAPTTQGGLGANLWQEFSRIGLPVRRGDFIAIGTAGQPGTDWSTITGIYLVLWTTTNQSVVVSFDDCYLTGGAGPDTSEPGAQKYDYRLVHVDLRTGARGNGSPIQAETLWLDSLRQPIRITPAAAYGDVNVRQEAYRRGGSLTDNWYFVGQNAADGGAIVDTLADADIAAADTLPTDNFQPIATVNDNGVTVLNQPVPIVFGPIGDGVFCALGDPFRPGHIYSCIAGSFDAWPSTSGYVVEACAPSEELMNGCVWGGQGFVLSRERGYSVRVNPAEVGITVDPTECRPGLAVRWGFCQGPGGIFYVARDGVRVTGGNESTLLGGNQLSPLFNGETVNGRLPINWSVPTAIRLALHNLDLRLLYQDTGGTRRIAVYSLLYQYWRFENFEVTCASVYSDEQPNLNTAVGNERLLLGGTNGFIYSNEGFSDAGFPIALEVRTGAWTFGDPRSQKVLGDLAVDLDQVGAAATVTTYLNAETTTNPAVVIPAATGRRQVVIQPFPATAAGEPQQARSASVGLTITAPTNARPRLFYIGVAAELFPTIGTDRVLAWGTWGTLSDKYLKGFLLDADTFGQTVSLQVRADGVVQQTVPVTHSGRSSKHYSFPQVLGRVFTITPTSGVSSEVYALQPLFDEEPYQLARWETQLLDLGLPDAGWGMLLSADVCYRAAVACTLTISCQNAAGVTTQTLVEALPSTGGAKQKRFIPFDANKGVLFKIVATTNDGSAGLTLYQEESRLRVQQWGGQLVLDRPFGDDDQDETRHMVNAVLAAERPGGGR